MEITIPVSNELVANALCSGLEGGINYWTAELDWPGDAFAQDHVLAGGSLQIRDVDDTTTTLDLAAVTRALGMLAVQCPARFAELVEDNADAGVGDCLIQLAVFSELRYG